MNNRDFAQDAETIISASVKVEGDFVSEGNVLIEGTVEGSLRTQKDLRVGEHAKITANVAAANAVIAGDVKGNVVVTDRLELEATARIQGDIVTRVLVVASGAMVNGKLTMAEAPVTERATPRRASRTAPVVEAREESVIEPVEVEEETHETVAAMAGGHAPVQQVAEPVVASLAPAPEEKEKKKSFNPFFTS